MPAVSSSAVPASTSQVPVVKTDLFTSASSQLDTLNREVKRQGMFPKDFIRFFRGRLAFLIGRPPPGVVPEQVLSIEGPHRVCTANEERFPKRTLWMQELSIFLDFSEILDNLGTVATVQSRNWRMGKFRACPDSP
jgi:hypothetical protein